MNQLKTILLLGALSALVVAAGAALGPQWMWGSLALALGMNLFAWFFSDRLVLRMSGAREVTREEATDLHQMVEELSTRAGLPKPRVFLIDADYANAFATGRNPEKAAVAVTRGLLEILRPARSAACWPTRSPTSRTATCWWRPSRPASPPPCRTWATSSPSPACSATGTRKGSPAGGLLFALVAPIGATLVQLGISRSREFLADETGARLSGDPLALAGALAKLHRDAEVVPAQAEPATASLYIVNPFGAGGSFTRLFSTHPPAEERIRRLRALALETPGNPLVRGAPTRRTQHG